MNKSKMLNTYKTVNNLKKSQANEPGSSPNSPKLYRSEYDEKLIKDYHFAKFQKNLDQIQNNPELAELFEKTEWNEEDIKTLLASFR